MAELALRFRLDLVQQAWEGFQAGRFASEVGERIGVNRTTARRMLVAAGGIRPRRGRNLQGRYLSFVEREEIAVGVASGESVRSIARRIGRAPSTVSRELARNAVRGRYRASAAQMSAFERARPKPAKLATNLRLRGREADLAKRRSPEQIAGRLRREFPEDREMQVSSIAGEEDVVVDMGEFEVVLDETTRRKLRGRLLDLARAAESVVTHGRHERTYALPRGAIDPFLIADQSLSLSILSAADHLRSLGKLISEPKVTVTLGSVSRGVIESLARGHWVAAGADADDVAARAMTLLRREVVVAAKGSPIYQTPGTAEELSSEDYLKQIDDALAGVGGTVPNPPSVTELSKQLLAAAYPLLDGVRKYAELSAIAHGMPATLGLYATRPGTLQLPELAALNVVGPAIGSAIYAVPVIAAAPVALFRGGAISDTWRPAVARLAPLINELQGRDLPD